MPNLEDLDPPAQEFAKEHRDFLEKHNPKLLKKLAQSNELPTYLYKVGKQADEMLSHMLSEEMHQTMNLPFHERVERLESLRASAEEIIRHDLILQPVGA